MHTALGVLQHIQYAFAPLKQSLFVTSVALRYNYSAAIASFRHALAIKPHDYR